MVWNKNRKNTASRQKHKKAFAAYGLGEASQRYAIEEIEEGHF